jgi:hypothetical protein
MRLCLDWSATLMMLLSPPMDRSKRRSKARTRSRERWRQMVFLAAIASVPAIGLFAVGQLEIEQLLARFSAAQSAPPPSEAEIYTGSILYLPDLGTTCRQFLFDNRNGRVQDNGFVDCEQAHYRGIGESMRQVSIPRAVVISQSFRGH